MVYRAKKLVRPLLEEEPQPANFALIGTVRNKEREKTGTKNNKHPLIEVISTYVKFEENKGQGGQIDGHGVTET